ncbi:MAG: TIGR00645 family protein, partial [Hyphomicrobiales bacterium]|nr:TIGR00645 family protein [Hyphomicrobiales bacterium]
KLLGSIVAIAAVSVLEWFTDIDRKADSVKLAWVVGILLAFAVAMLVLAIADRVSGATADRP